MKMKLKTGKLLLLTANVQLKGTGKPQPSTQNGGRHRTTNHGSTGRRLLIHITNCLNI
jgi:hypothetical protein